MEMHFYSVNDSIARHMGWLMKLAYTIIFQFLLHLLACLKLYAPFWHIL